MAVPEPPRKRRVAEIERDRARRDVRRLAAARPRPEFGEALDENRLARHAARDRTEVFVERQRLSARYPREDPVLRLGDGFAPEKRAVHPESRRRERRERRRGERRRGDPRRRSAPPPFSRRFRRSRFVHAAPRLRSQTSLPSPRTASAKPAAEIAVQTTRAVATAVATGSALSKKIIPWGTSGTWNQHRTPTSPAASEPPRSASRSAAARIPVTGRAAHQRKRDAPVAR